MCVCIRGFWGTPPRALVHCHGGMGTNFLGWGPNVTGLALGSIFFGVYFGSSYLTKQWIMRNSDEPPQPAKYFRDMKVVKNVESREPGQ